MTNSNLGVSKQSLSDTWWQRLIDRQAGSAGTMVRTPHLSGLASLSMREHQIVITLKPEQFLEVQRLARAANAKSMGMFVRQKLLAALGIEGNLTPTTAGQQPLSPQAVNQILMELHRLHGELRGFVADSVAPYSIEPPVDKSAAATLGAPLPETSPISDDFEELAGRTFAISPRLGELESPPAVVDSLPDPLESVLSLRDPLEVLLNEESMPKMSKPEKGDKQLLIDDDDEQEYIPLSQRQKRSEKAGTTAEPAVAQQSIKDGPDKDGTPSALADEDAEGSEIPQPNLRSQDSQPPNNVGGNTPFSGGPPPKRRRE